MIKKITLKNSVKIIDNKYVISEVGLLKYSFPGFKVVENETYDYFICEEGPIN